MAWRVARSLDVLLAQLNALAPKRSKVSDGSIGDTSHQNRSSDHNPWYGPGIVTARDFTHDPAHLNCHSLADRLVAGRDPRIKYVIWNRRIWSPGAGWRRYTGPNPHTSHLHLSVVASPLCDDTKPWAGFTAGRPGADDIEEEEVTTVAPGMLALDPKTGKVYYSNLIQRRWIEDETELEGVKWHLKRLGLPTDVVEVKDIRVLGVDVTTAK
jgi:hypothetical protein